MFDHLCCLLWWWNCVLTGTRICINLQFSCCLMLSRNLGKAGLENYCKDLRWANIMPLLRKAIVDWGDGQTTIFLIKTYVHWFIRVIKFFWSRAQTNLHRAPLFSSTSNLFHRRENKTSPPHFNMSVPHLYTSAFLLNVHKD